MKVNIKLFGLLGIKLPEFNKPEGVEIELSDNSTAGDLLEYLKIPEDWGPAVTMGNRLLKYDDPISDGADIFIIQAVHGG